MVNQLLTEKEILDYLMTSDFNEGLTNEESKFLLLKYRSFYRLSYAKYEHSLKVIDELNKAIEKKDAEIKSSSNTIHEISTKLELEEVRELSFRERFLGKKIKKK